MLIDRFVVWRSEPLRVRLPFLCAGGTGGVADIVSEKRCDPSESNN